MVPEPGLRERKRRDTREAITGAALRLAAERGPDRVTVEEIARAADVSTRTFFNYFSSKEAAILNVNAERLQELHDLVLARPPEEPPLEALKNAMVEAAGDLNLKAETSTLRLEVIRKYPQLYPTYCAAFADAERHLLDAVAARTGLDPDRDVYPSLVVAAGVAAMRLALARAQTPGVPDDAQSLIAESFTLLGRGLVAPVALHLLEN